MPTYDYECEACDHRFEEFQSISADPLTKCPKCKKKKLKRLIGAGAAVVFKGSGFYQTDYRSDSYTKAASADKPSESSSSSDSKSETKSEAKSESKSSPAPDKSAKKKGE